jgi:hypothetical protein
MKLLKGIPKSTGWWFAFAVGFLVLMFIYVRSGPVRRFIEGA